MPERGAARGADATLARDLLPHSRCTLARLTRAELVLKKIPIRDLPLYHYDYDAAYPPVAKTIKQAIAEAAEVDVVLFVTPESNRSIPGALKNAIDWASRPYGQNAFARKPSAVIGTSPGATSTAVREADDRSLCLFTRCAASVAMGRESNAKTDSPCSYI